MNEQEFKAKTKRFAVEVIGFVETLARGRTSDVIGRQLIRASTSVGANYRAACRSRSTADMIAKLKLVEEECDESMYWMELLVEAGITTNGHVSLMMREANEILAMTVASIRTLRTRNTRSKG